MVPPSYYTPPFGGRITVSNHSRAQDVVSDIREHQLANHDYGSDAHIWLMLNRQWYARRPGRFKNFVKRYGARIIHSTEPLQNTRVTTLVPAENPRKILTPGDWGPIFWKFLNLLPTSWDKDYFLRTIRYILDFIDPENPHNNGAGCSVCHSHFSEFITRRPPEAVSNASEAAQWALDAHNNVRAMEGKRLFTYDELRAQYGAP